MTEAPGLQPERTALSWTRTWLALVVVSLLVWRSWAHDPSTAGLLAALAATAAGGALLGLGWRRVRHLRHHNDAASTTFMTTITALFAVLVASVCVAVAS